MFWENRRKTTGGSECFREEIAAIGCIYAKGLGKHYEVLRKALRYLWKSIAMVLVKYRTLFPEASKRKI
jgi:hypothetical protein